MKLNLKIPYDTKSKIALIIISILLGAISTIAYDCFCESTDFEMNDGISFNLSMKEQLIAWPCMAFAIGTMLHLTNLFYVRTMTHSWPRLERFVPTLDKKRFIIFIGITLLCWLPYRLSYLPCYMEIDTFHMLSQFFDWNQGHTAQFSDHHPVFDALVFGAFCLPSYHFTGNFNVGLAIVTTLTEVIIAIELIWCIAYARKRDANPLICFIAYIFICIVPIFPYYALAAVKDTLHATVLIPWVICVMKIVTKDPSISKNKRFFIVFALLGLLCALTKKTGIYVVAITLMVLIISKRDLWKPLLGQLITCTMVMWMILPCIVFPLYGIELGSIREAIGMPIQQTTALYKQNELSDRSIDIAESIMDLDLAAKNYKNMSTDLTKEWFDDDSDKRNIIHYLADYARCGIEHPYEYLTTLLKVNAGYIVPVEPMWMRPDPFTSDTSLDTNSLIRACVDKNTPQGDTVMSMTDFSLNEMGWFLNLFYHLLTNPIVNLFTSPATWTTIIPTLLLWCAWRTKRLSLVAFTPLIIAWIFCIIGPLVDARYSFSVAVNIPLLMCFIAVPKTRERRCWMRRRAPLKLLKKHRTS